MGILENKKNIRIDLDGRETIRKELDINSNLQKIRIQLLNTIPFPFIYLDSDENEIPKEREKKKKLKEILDGRNLTVKKEVKKREKLGKLIETKGQLEYYLYPTIQLTEKQKERSSNIMIIGET